MFSGPTLGSTVALCVEAARGGLKADDVGQEPAAKLVARPTQGWRRSLSASLAELSLQKLSPSMTIGVPFRVKNGSAPMPLNRVNRLGIETAHGVHFGMMSDAASVRVLVTREVLQTIQGSAAPHGLAPRFEFYRREFEAIASDKFDRGERGALKITASDLLRFAAEKRAARPSI